MNNRVNKMKNNILNIPNLSLIDNCFFYLGIKIATLNIYQGSRSVGIGLVHIQDITKAIEIAEKLNAIAYCTVTHYDKTEKNEERYIIDAHLTLSDGRFVSVVIQGKDNTGFIYDLEYARKIKEALKEAVTIEA